MERMEGMEGNGREGRGKGFSQTGQVRHKKELHWCYPTTNSPRGQARRNLKTALGVGMDL